MTVRTRVRARVDGVVQGVGFRPFAHRLAVEHELAGWVAQRRRGVAARGRGRGRRAVERFLAALARAGAAPGGRSSGCAPRAAARRPASAAFASCDSERTPERRRHCVGRRRAVRGVPGGAARPGRPSPPLPVHQLHRTAARASRSSASSRTTASARRWPTSPMCAACRAEYEDPAGRRRFHAQPNACPQCGPRLRLIDAQRRCARQPRTRLRAAAAALLGADEIVAVKGLGGYHLACRADDECGRRRAAPPQAPRGEAVRPDDAGPRSGARRARRADATEQGLLASAPERPIVIARRRPGRAGRRIGRARLAGARRDAPLDAAAPAAAGDVGTALVMTSGNRQRRADAHLDDGDALARLGPIADARARPRPRDRVRADDSVVRALGASARPAAAAARARLCARGASSCPRRCRRCSRAAPS